MANVIVHPGLTDLTNVLGDEKMIFGELLGWGTHEAISKSILRGQVGSTYMI
jgi:hypothetical protein